MTTFKEIKDIVSKLEIIEEMKEPLQSLLADINTLLQQGKSWIDNKENKTFQEMKEILESEIAKFLRQCFNIASNGHKRFSEPALTKNQLNQASNFVSVAMANTTCADKAIDDMKDKDDEQFEIKDEQGQILKPVLSSALN